ncbi:MAG TPA: hypothetical protein VMA72_24810 [Streptosporangiaceae bacterium]|nr:hypothetical protein [Streptosporangiaceae bacterium]
MDNLNLGSAKPEAAPAAPRRFGRAKRVTATVAASVALLGSGAAIGIALTGGASASTTTHASAGSSPSAGSQAAGTPAAIAAKCAKVAAKLRKSGHPAVAMRLHAFCTHPLVRLALVGGEHGQVTFPGKTGANTVAFERGTVESVTSSAVTVKAPDSTTWTWDLIAGTNIRAAGQGNAHASLAVGDRVLVIGKLVSGARDARLIRIGAAG